MRGTQVLIQKDAEGWRDPTAARRLLAPTTQNTANLIVGSGQARGGGTVRWCFFSNVELGTWRSKPGAVALDARKVHDLISRISPSACGGWRYAVMSRRLWDRRLTTSRMTPVLS
jgi:hypothetical protein